LLEMLTGLEETGDRWTRGPWQPDRRHVVDLIAGELEARGIPVPSGRRAPRLQVTPVSLSPGPTALINPHSGSTLKEAPVDLWCEIVRGLGRLGVRSFVLEAPGTSEDPRLLEAAPGVEPLSAPLPELAALIAGASVVISPDTGILHMAAAVHTPHVGLFGSTDPAFCGPYNREGGELLEAPIDHPPACRGCWRAQMLPSARCPIFEPESCLSTLSGEAIVAAAIRVMHHDGRPPEHSQSSLRRASSLR
ncbi:MAG: glycosyltransferase family 9 protein, partial [Candidatus Dormibacteria bacterium]